MFMVIEVLGCLFDLSCGLVSAPLLSLLAPFLGLRFLWTWNRRVIFLIYGLVTENEKKIQLKRKYDTIEKDLLKPTNFIKT